MNYYLGVFKKYATFSGRARRAEYWYFILFHVIALIALTVVDYTIGTVDGESGYGMVMGIYVLFSLIPVIAVSVRRLHDIGKSGRMVLISFIPLIGSIWLLVLYLQDSEPGDNQYGSNPKGVQATYEKTPPTTGDMN